jgi:4-oxalocrotonate tautomerase family enzyme
VPFIQVTCIEGPSPDQCAAVIERLTQVVMDEFRVPAGSVNVVVTMVPASRWGSGGHLLGDVLAAQAAKPG